MDLRTINIPDLHGPEDEIHRAEVFPHEIRHAELVRLEDHDHVLALVVTFNTGHGRSRRYIFLIDRELEFIHALYELLDGVMPGRQP